MFIKVINNTISNSFNGGIVFELAKGGYNLVENNAITGIQGNGNFDAIQLGVGSTGGTQYTAIRNNTITGNGSVGDTIDTSGHGIMHHLLIEGNKVSNSQGDLKFHCGVAVSTLGPGYDQGLYGVPGAAGWYTAGVSCHSIVRHNVWQDQQMTIYNYPMPIAYYNNTMYESTPRTFVLLARSCGDYGQAPGLVPLGDTTYPGSGSEQGVFVMKNNIWWSEGVTSTFTNYWDAVCSPLPVPVHWNYNYDSMRTKSNLFKNPNWQEWYGALYTTSLTNAQNNGNDTNNRPETGSVESAIAGALAFSNVATSDFSPTIGSPARNMGTALTTVKIAVTNSVTVTVDRATFFFDGYCIASECLGTRDTIRIGTSAPVQVVSVNAITNVLTLSAPVTAAVNAPVSLAIHPIQGIALTSHTPDVGARQYVASATTPVANFTCSPLSGRVPLAVPCTDSSSNTPTAWGWTFGDTGTSTLQNPLRTYTSAGTYTVALSATNAAGSNTLTRVAYVAVSQTLFTTQAPSNANATDGVPYELGMKFKSTKAGKILAVRYYKAASDTGTHGGKIWSATGTLLASITFTGETASGWQEKALASPLTIAANTTYVVSVNVGGYFPITTNSFPPSPSLPLTNGSLSVVNDGANGVFGAPAVFPTSSYQNSNYFRDVVFLPN